MIKCYIYNIIRINKWSYNTIVRFNTTSTTMLNNLNCFSSYTYLNISGTNNNLNSLSTNSILLINGRTTQLSNLNTTPTTILII